MVAVVLFLPLAQMKAVFFGIPLYSVEVPVLAALGAYVYGRMKGQFPLPEKDFFHNPLIIGANLFFLGAVFSFVANPFSLTGLGMLKTWFIFPLLMSWLFLQAKPSESERNFILNTWLAITTLAAGSALTYTLTDHLTYDGRLAAWFVSPNYLAIFIAPGIFIAFQKLRRAMEEKGFKTCLLPIVSLLILFPPFFFTRSFGAWSGVFGAVILTTLLFTRAFAKKNLWKILSGIVIVGALFFSFEYDNPKWQSFISFDGRSSLSSRMMIWQSAGKMIYDNPLLGIGPGRFQEVYLEYQKYYPPYLEWAVPQPHNIILAVWLQTGLLGLLGFVLLVTRSIYILIKNKNRESALLLGLLTLYIIYGLFDTPYFKTDLAFSFWFVIALIFTFSQPAELLSHKSIR